MGFHEAQNMAAIFSLPVIYLCENNMYAISMCSDDAIACRDVAKRSAAYDIPGVIVDGTDPEEIYNIVSKAVQRARSGKGPSLIEAKTYRFGGHHPNDPAEYRDKSEAEYYKKEKDPVVNYKAKLLEESDQPEEIGGYEKEIIQMVEQSVNCRRKPEPSLEQFLRGQVHLMVCF